MKFLITTIILAAFLSLNVHAQMTSGGSSDRWEQYSVILDTVDKEVPIEIKSTSKSYFRFSRLRSRDLLGSKNTFDFNNDFYEFPHNGFKGLVGNDLPRAFEIVFGGYSNWTTVNNELHPGIDLSSIIEIGFQFGERQHVVEDFYRLDYGGYFGGGMGTGVAATLKPFLIAEHENELLYDVLVDVGYRLDMLFYGNGPTTLEVDDIWFESDPSRYYDLTREIEPDEIEPVGIRLDGIFSIGVRYKFIGIRWETSSILSSILRPEYEVTDYYHEHGTFFPVEIQNDFFEEEIDYRFSKIGILLFF